MEFIQLEVLQHIAENGSIQRTAEELQISPGTVRNHLLSLENELRYEIFIPGSHFLLNKNGEIVLKHTRKILSLEQDLKNRIHDFDDLADSVTVMMESAFPLIHPLIRDFQLHYPHIKIKCLQMPVFNSQQDFRADLMIQVASQPAQSDNAVTLFKTKLSLAFSADHPLSRRLFLDLDEVHGEEFILPSRNQDLRHPIDTCFELVNYTPNVPIEVDNPNLLRRLVACNAGISLLLPSIIQSEKDENICLVPLRHPEGTVYMNLCWNQLEWLSPAACNLRDYILAYFRVSPDA